MTGSHSLKVYTYTCARHPVGVLVRFVSTEEFVSLARVKRPHFTNCWVKGCQDPIAEVRLVEVAQ